MIKGFRGRGAINWVNLEHLFYNYFKHIFQKCLRKCLSAKGTKITAFPVIQAEFERAKGDVDSKRIFLDQSFRDCVTSDWKLDMEKCSDLVQLSIKGVICIFNMSSCKLGKGAVGGRLTFKFVYHIKFIKMLIIILGVRAKMCSDNLPIILLSDMFDIISLEDCEKLFFCVEENINEWKEAAFLQAVKNHILRICNGKNE